MSQPVLPATACGRIVAGRPPMGIGLLGLLGLMVLFVGAPASALATETKTGGDWLDDSIWTDGVPHPGGLAYIAGHGVKLKGFGWTSVLRNDGSLEITTEDPPANGIGSLSVGLQLVVGYVSTGSLTLNKGGRLTSGSTYIGYAPGSNGLITLDGAPEAGGARSSWANSGELAVGSSGFGPATGGVLVFGGATVSTVNTSIGAGVSQGLVQLNDGVWTNANLFKVGSGGTVGRLMIGPRGALSSLTGVIGYGGGSTSALTDTLGEADLDGGSWKNAGEFHVGHYAQGQLSVRNGGLVENTIGYIGYAETSVGIAKFWQSTWTNSGRLYVGYEGQGTLLISQGSTVSSAGGNIGTQVLAKGRVEVNDARWINAGDLYVGGGSEGVLTIRNGGSVSASFAVLAADQNAIGSVSVSGVNGSGVASSWTITGDLRVGDRGHGKLTVEDGGIVRAADTYLGYRATGELDLHGSAGRHGTLETRQVNGGSGGGPQNATLSLDGGLLRATVDQADFLRNIPNARVEAGGALIDSQQYHIGIASALIGPGGLSKLGSGVLELRGFSALGSLSSVTAGSLLVNGSLNGDVQVESGATLGGNGLIQGRVTVLPGGTLSPGNSPGTLTLGGLAMVADSLLVIELGSPGDQLVVLGDLTLDGRIDFSGDPALLVAGSSPSFLHYGGLLVNHGIVIGTLPAGLDPAAYVLDFSTPGQLGVRQVVVVPEPGTALLLAVGGAALLLKCRRRRVTAEAPGALVRG